jgi:hypothetical protein
MGVTEHTVYYANRRLIQPLPLPKPPPRRAMPLADFYNLVEPSFRPRAPYEATLQINYSLPYVRRRVERLCSPMPERKISLQAAQKNRLAGEKPLIEIVWVLDHNPNLSAKIGQGCAEENERDKKQNPDTSLVRQFEKRRNKGHNHEEQGRQCAADRPQYSAVDEFGARIQAGYVGNPDKIG